MWGSKRTERSSFDDLLDERESPEARPSPPPPPMPAMESSSPAPRKPVEEVPTAPAASSVLGRTLHFRGDLSADEDLILQGRVEGSITHKGNLTIGEDGATTGNVSARQIIVEGHVNGDLTAEAFVSVRASGHVKGSIISPRVALADGAHFNGKIEMNPQKSSRGSKTDSGSKTTDAAKTPSARASGTSG